jgi:hypothetical protein
MADKDTIWTAVKARYDSAGLTTLTNILDPSQTTVDDTVGTEAANGVLNLWPAYAQVAFDINDGTHTEAAVLGTIATLWRRGGSSTTIEQVKWDEVFGPDGIIAKIRRTNPRAHGVPSSNSGVSQKAEQTSAGGRYRGWSDRESLPAHYMPRRTTVSDT